MSHPLPDHAHPIVTAVRRFVETEVLPVASSLEHADAYPHDLMARMRALGLFGALIPEAHGGLGLSVSTYARVIEELCGGFMSLAGVINSHTMAALIVLHHGTDEQRLRFLPRFARGEARGGLCLTEPHAGSDVQAIRTVARRAGDHYLLSGTKMFVTNGREGNTFALLARTDTSMEPPHRGMSCFIVEKGHPGLQVVKSIAKLGYKGVDTAELLFDGFPVPAANLVGGVEGRGFKHVMSGLETGQINIAARAVGVAQAALDEARSALRTRQDREDTLPALCDMAIRVEASRLLTYWAAGMKDRSERCDLEAGMAKLYASESAQEVAVAAMRVTGPSNQRLDSPLERFYRDTPLMIIGEGANEIQRLLIARQLLERHGERGGALTSRQGEPEERRQLVLAVRRLVEKELIPVAQEHDRAGRYPAALVERLAELGVFGAGAPPEYGGLGLDPVTAVMIVEEVARGSGMLASLLAAHLATGWVVARHALSAERERLLPSMTRAESLGTLALDGSVTARPAGRDWRLTGTVPAVQNAARAGLLVVRAALDGAATGCFLVGRETANLSVGASLETLGMRRLGAADIRLDDVPVAAFRRLGSDDRQSAQAAAALDAMARLGAAATAVGIAVSRGSLADNGLCAYRVDSVRSHGWARRHGTGPLPTTSCVLRSQPDRQNGLSVSYAPRYRFRVLLLVAALAIVAGVVSGCISVKSYVDPELPKAGYGDLLLRRDKRPIAVSLQFQRNGNGKPAISERVQERAKTILATTNLFSAVSISSGDNVDRLDLVLNNIADIGDDIGKGITTGLNFGGVGSRVTDSYVLTATFKPTIGPAVQKIYRHALHSTIGNADPPLGATRMSVQQAFDRVLQHLLLKLMRDLQTEELLQ